MCCHSQCSMNPQLHLSLLELYLQLSLCQCSLNLRLQLHMSALYLQLCSSLCQCSLNLQLHTEQAAPLQLLLYFYASARPHLSEPELHLQLYKPLCLC